MAGARGAVGGSTRARGRAAEEAAARWLAGQGFRVLARNHAVRGGEVDLICREGEYLCFVEVRSRARADYGSAGASVDAAKSRRVVRAGADWARAHGGLGQAMRFDVVSVDLSGAAPRFELFRGAFDADGRRR